MASIPKDIAIELANLEYNKIKIFKILQDDVIDFEYVLALRSFVCYETSKKQLTEKLGFDKSYISRVLAGKSKPSPELKRKIETYAKETGKYDVGRLL